MRSEYWMELWNKSAKENEDIRFISGWGNRTFQDMLLVITDVARKLELKNNENLLDIGCGAGLFEIAFSPWLKEIYGSDYSKEMVSLAKKNTEMFNNVIIEHGDIRNLPFSNGFFDKVLVNSVIQYLNNFVEVQTAFQELERITGKKSRILISLIPDANKKEMFLKGYYNMGLSEEEIKHKIEANENVIWFEKDDLKKIAESYNFQVIDFLTPINNFQKKYYFDMIIKK